MKFDFDVLEDQNVLIARLGSEFSMKDDLEWIMDEARKRFDAMPRSFYYVTDVFNVTMTFTDVVTALAAAASGSGSLFRHPKLARLYIVADNALANIGGKALQQAQYGGLDSRVVKSVEEALEAIRNDAILV